MFHIQGGICSGLGADVFANGFGLAEALHISELELAWWKRKGGGEVWQMLPSAIPTYAED
jgi:hypothetical protein